MLLRVVPPYQDTRVSQRKTQRVKLAVSVKRTNSAGHFIISQPCEVLQYLSSDNTHKSKYIATQKQGKAA